MEKNRYSLNILLVELIHFLIGFVIGLVPYAAWAGIPFLLWKELYRDPHKHFDCWLWQVPAVEFDGKGSLTWPSYRWGPGKSQVIGFKTKGQIDLVIYLTGIAAGRIVRM